jgi:hypothetical protein
MPPEEPPDEPLDEPLEEELPDEPPEEPPEELPEELPEEPPPSPVPNDAPSPPPFDPPHPAATHPTAQVATNVRSRRFRRVRCFIGLSIRGTSVCSPVFKRAQAAAMPPPRSSILESHWKERVRARGVSRDARDSSRARSGSVADAKRLALEAAPRCQRHSSHAGRRPVVRPASLTRAATTAGAVAEVPGAAAVGTAAEAAADPAAPAGAAAAGGAVAVEAAAAAVAEAAAAARSRAPLRVATR